MIFQQRTVSSTINSSTSTALGTSWSESPGTHWYSKIEPINGNYQGNKKFPNPFSFTKTERFGEGLSKYLVDKAYGRPSYQSINGIDYVAPQFVPSAQIEYGSTRDAALEKVYDKIRGNSNLVVDLAESAATLKMLKGTLSLKRVFSDFMKEMIGSKGYKRRKKASNQQRLDYVTGKWLEYRYGWMPFVHSIYDAMDTHAHKNINEIFYARGRSSRVKNEKGSFGSMSYSDPRFEVDVVQHFRTEMCILFRLPQGTQIYDWTTLNPVKIAWELTPLSFVADWVTNVSQQLDLLENYALFASKFYGGYITDSSKRIVSSTSYGFSSGQTTGQNTFRTTRAGSLEVISTLNRSILTGLPLPSGIRFQLNLGANRQLDAAALFHQLVAKRVRNI